MNTFERVGQLFPEFYKDMKAGDAMAEATFMLLVDAYQVGRIDVLTEQVNEYRAIKPALRNGIVTLDGC